MNAHEFAALKVGDQIENLFSRAKGEIVSTDATGVRVRWLGSGPQGEGSRSGAISPPPTWHYAINSTAWMHWSLAGAVQ